MTPLKRNLSRLLFLILVLLLGGTLFGIVYFLKMERNEDILNTLYFRELQQIEGTIHRTLKKVEKTSAYSLPENFQADENRLERAKNNIRLLSMSSNELRDLKVLNFDEKRKFTNDVIKNKPVFTFSLPEYDTVRFEQTGYYGTNTELTLTLQSSITHVLGMRLNRFQTVALVEEGGEVKSVVNNATKLVDDPELFFRNISNLAPVFDSEGDERSAHNTSSQLIRLSGTRYNDVEFDDTTYRVYLHPITSKGMSADDKNYYLVGIVKKRLIISQKLKLPPDMLMWLILALILLIAIIPLLKLRFISATYPIQPADKSQIVLGLIVAVGIITIGLSQQLFQDYLIDVKDKQLKKLHQEISREVTDELKTLMDITSDLLTFNVNESNGIASGDKDGSQAFYQNSLPHPFPNICHYGIQRELLESCVNSLVEFSLTEIPWKPGSLSYVHGFLLTFLTLPNPLDANCYESFFEISSPWQPSYSDIKGAKPIYDESLLNPKLLGRKVLGRNNCYFLESFASLNDKGYVIDDKSMPVSYISANIVNTTKLELSSREYFKAGLKDEYWEINFDDGYSQKVFMERVFNIEDGRRNLMFTVPPLYEGKASADKSTNKLKMYFAGTRLSSLTDRILPDSFGFAVIDDKGKVIFHSDDSLSLIENFIIETSQHALLRAAINSGTKQSVPIQLDYKGVPHRMVMGSLLIPDIPNNIPWHLVVFFDPTEVNTNNMVMVFTTVFLFLLVVIPGFVIFRYVTVQCFWGDLCYFNSKKRHCYSWGALLIFAAGLFVTLQMGWVVSLSGRLFLWALTAGMLAYLLIYCWQLRYSMYYRWRRPLFAFAGLCIPVFIGALFTWNDDHKIILENKVSALTGFVLIVAASSALLKNSQCKLWQNPLINKVWAKGIVYPCIAALAVIALYQSFLIITCIFMLIGMWQIVLRYYWKPSSSRPKNDIEKVRFSTGHVWFLTSLIYFAASVPATIILFSAHDYLLSRQALFEEQAIKQEIEEKNESFNEYIRFLAGDACEMKSEQGRVAYSPFKSLCNVKLSNKFELITERFFKLERNVAYKTHMPEWVTIHSEVNESTTNSTDKLFNYLFGSTLGETEFISQLALAAKNDLMENNPADVRQLQYRADLFLMEPLKTPGGLMIAMLMFIGMPAALYLTVRQLIVRRMMGEHILGQYQVNEMGSAGYSYQSDFPELNFQKLKIDGRSQLILNTTRLKGEIELLKISQQNGSFVIFDDSVFRITECLDKFTCIDEHSDAFHFVKKVERFVKKHSGENVVVALSALEQLSLNPQSRKDALSLLFELHLHKDIVLVMVAETAPLYRLLNPNAYELDASVIPDVDEKASWSKLFAEFDKSYAWSPMHKFLPENPFNVCELLSHECAAWPEINSVWQQLEIQKIREPEQAIEFMLVHAGPLYRRKWEECTINEKIILWRMAHGATINPQSAVTIERLVRRCYLYRDKGWHLINESFRQFVLTAEPESVMKSWMDNTSTGVWSIIRIPIFAILLVLMAAFIYSSGSSLDSLLGIATAALGLIPLMIKNLSLLKGGGSDIE